MTAKHLVRVVFATLAVVFFATPLALRAVGVTAEEFENRRLATAPRVSQGWDAFGQTTRYLVDHMPLRAQAVRANTRIWTDVFDTDPPYSRDTALANDQALPFAGAVERDGDIQIEKGRRGTQGVARASSGSDGWFYFTTEFEAACETKVPNELRLERWARLVRAVRESGRESVMVVAPSKSSVYPEHLPKRYPFDDCAPRARERFWRLLSREGPRRGVLDVRSELLRLKEHAGDGLFQRADSHWTTLGALTMVKAVLASVGNGVRLKSSEIAYRGAVDYTGDLSVAGGASGTDTRDEYGIERPPGAPRVPGRTLLICDSFAYKWMRLFRAYFEDVRYTYWTGDPKLVIDAIRRSDTVIFEANETWMKLQPGYSTLPVAVARALESGDPEPRVAP